MNTAPGRMRLHGVVQVARLGAVALVDEHEQVALGLEPLGQRLLQLLDEALDVADRLAVLLAAELVDERADQPGLWR
jgi:hypothetical protein